MGQPRSQGLSSYRSWERYHERPCERGSRWARTKRARVTSLIFLFRSRQMFLSSPGACSLAKTTLALRPTLMTLLCTISDHIASSLAPKLTGPVHYVTFLPCQIQFKKLNSTQIRRLNRLPHFCRTFDWTYRIIRQKCDTDSNFKFLPYRS